MSSVEEPELKGGHPPAVKAGGMRITQTNNASEKDAKASPTKDEKAVTDGALTKSEKHNQQLLISGANTKGDLDFQPDAIKHYHEKHIPSREKHDRGATSGHGKDIYLFQPR